MKFRTLLLGLSALFVAFNAAFFSVTGLGKLFAGASLSVILMASSLELAKLILAGYLYNYWEKINKGFRIYLSIATLVLVLITSLGIYGFLTSAFQNTFKTYSLTSTEKTFLQQKEKFWEDDLVRYDKELDRISENIATLSSAKSQQIQYTDRDGTVRNTVSTAELRAAQSRIATEEVNRKEVQSKRQTAADSLQSIKIKILEIDTNTEVGSELGPLEYLSGLLGKPMDQIINWFILIIIFVFDPLAVSLVIAFNNAMKVDKGEDDKKKVVQKRELYGEDVSSESIINENITELNDNEGSDIYTKDDFKDWDTTLSDGLDEEDEWDEDHALDEVMNDMVSNVDMEELNEDLFGEEDDVPYEDSKVETDVSTTDDELANLKRDTNRRGIDLDGDGTIDGYDNNGDGLIDEPVPTSSRRAQYIMKEVPYYAKPNFNWGDRKAWINNQNAVNYWLTYVKNQKDTSYPTDFDSKTY
jgi:hypothetical protein